MQNYYFRKIEKCEMCGNSSQNHKILGQRLNQSQGLSPKKKIGIAVSIIKCTNCNLVYSNPQPIPSDIQDHYGTPPEDYWKKEYFELKENYFSAQIAEVKQLLKHKSKIVALDIGAGLGKAMISMEKAGFDVYGLEPSIPFYERAISKMGVNKERIFPFTIEDYQTNQKFDFISFGAVFEHLYEPAKCLEKSLEMLNPDGVIYIEVPNADWLIPKFINFYNKLLGTNYVTNLSPMHPPYHLHEFNVKSFVELSKRLPFIVEKSRVDVCSILFAPKAIHPLLKKYMELTNRGMQLTVYLRKV